jgi:hypothetical protein
VSPQLFHAYPQGVRVFAQKMSTRLGVTPSEFLSEATNQSPALADFLETYCVNRVRYRERLVNFVANPIELTSESHLGGEHVILDESSNIVLYSTSRAIPTLFSEICVWFSTLKGTNFSRPILSVNKYHFCRPYIVPRNINDSCQASWNAGQLLAVAWYSGTTDLHRGNIVFEGNVPIVIDDECASHPLRSNQIQMLADDRRHYPTSPFRTILIQEQILGSRKAESGFHDLLKHGVSWKEFVAGFMDAYFVMRRRREELKQVVLNSVRSNRIGRYLVRGTEMYDAVICAISSNLFFDKKNNRAKIFKLFSREIALFPETEACVTLEVQELEQGDVPYWTIDYLSGELRLGRSEAIIACLEQSPLVWLDKHIRQIEAKPIAEVVEMINNRAQKFIE